MEAAKDLDQILSDIPDASLGMDWEYLARQIRHDLLMPPAQALANLNTVRQSLLKTGGGRMFFIGSRASQTALQPGINALHASLALIAMKPATYSATRLIEARLRGRGAEKQNPVYVGLVNPNTQGGVFLNSAPLASYLDADNRDLLLDFLASRLTRRGGRARYFPSDLGAGGLLKRSAVLHWTPGI